MMALDNQQDGISKERKRRIENLITRSYQRVAEEKNKEELKTMKAPYSKMLLRFASNFDIFLIVVGYFFAIATGVLMPSIAVLQGDIVNNFNTTQEGIDRILRDAGIMFVFGSVLWISSALYYMFLQALAYRLGRKYRVNFLLQVLRQEVAWFDQINANELNQIMVSQTQAIERALGEKSGTFVMCIFYCISGLLYSFFTSWQLSLAISLLMPFYFLATFMIALKMKKGTLANMKAYAQSQGFAEQALNAIMTVQAFGQEMTEQINFDSYLFRAKQVGERTSWQIALCIGCYYFFFHALFAYTCSIGTAFIVNQVINPNSGYVYSYGDVLTCYLCIMKSVFTMAMSIPHLKVITEGQLAAYQTFLILDRKPKIQLDEDLSQRIMSPQELEGKIEFRDVTFSFPNSRGRIVLDNFSAVFEEGKTTAIVGVSGSGKSTIAQLISRFYDPDHGSILLDGIDIKKFNLRDLRRMIGYVNQEPVLFHSSVRENLLYSNPYATEDEIVSCLQRANAFKFINDKMVEGLDTKVGVFGTQLSGGQKQRIAIARALLKNPKLLVLDEATSALDSKNEIDVQRAIDQIKRRLGKVTTIIVAHRLSTVRKADCILVVDRGRVVESGSHEELLERFPGGHYARFVGSQEEGAGLVVVDHRTVQETGFVSSEIRSEVFDDLSPIKDSEMEEIEQRFLELENSRAISAFGKDLPTEEQERLDAKMHAGANEKDAIIQNEIASATLDSLRTHGIFKRLMQYSRPRRNIIVGLLSSAVFGSILPVLAIFLSKIVFILEGYFGEEDMAHQAYMICMGVMIFAVFSFFIAVAQKHSFGLIGESLILVLRQQLFKSILGKELAWFDERTPASLSALMAKETVKVKGAAAEGVATQLEATFALISASIICLIYSWQIGLICIAIIPIMFIANTAALQFQTGIERDQSEHLKPSSNLAADVICNYKLVAALANEEHIVSDYDALLDGPHRRALKQTIAMGFLFGFSKFALYGSYAFIYYCCTFFLARPGADPYSLYTAQLVANQGTKSAANATVYGPDIGGAKQSAFKIFSIIDRPSQINAMYQVNRKEVTDVHSHIVFKNVWFRYPARKSDWVLRNLNLTINANETVALVGESGSGKSTVMQLLLRFYDVNFGTITIDGVDIRDISLPNLRRLFGVVFQEPSLFNYSIYENVLYGNAEALNSQIIEATTTAYAKEFIERMTDFNEHENIEETFENLRKQFEFYEDEIVRKIGADAYAETLKDLVLFEEMEAEKGLFISVAGGIDQRDGSYKDVDLDAGFFQQCGVRGSKLSGGQKQRIAIARALVRDPSVLLLDEATSSLDEDSQFKVQQALEAILGKRTTIVIAHRQTTIEKCGQIYMLENGRLAEQGKYEELMRKQGRFAQMHFGFQ